MALQSRFLGLATAASTVAVCVGAQAPGSTRWSPDGLVEYRIGNAPIVVTAGHGGDLRPPSIPDRTYGTLVKDTRTLELAREFAAGLEQRFRLYPHVVFFHLHRIKCDVNRDVVEGAQGDPQAIVAWQAFHQACSDARLNVQQTWGAGIYLDLHGHGHPENWIELGYALSAAQLALPDGTLAQPTYVAQSTLRSVGGLPGVFFPDVLRGSASLGAFLQQGGYDSVPGPAFPHPAGGNYFDGGYNVRTYGSQAGGSVDGVQLELPWSVRRTVLVRRPFADRIGGWIQQFLPQLRGFDPASGARVTIRALDRVASETGGRGEFVVRRTGDLGTARIVPLQVGGSAQNGVDYAALPQFAAFAPGQAEVRLPLACRDDGLAEPDEVVAVQLLGGVDIGVPARAEIVLHDDETNGGLALHLPLDAAGATTPDVAGNLRHGTLLPAGSGPGAAASVRGGALRFDGVDDRVRVADFAYAPGGEFSLAFWFRAAPTAGNGFRYLASHGGTAASNRLGVYFEEATGTLRTALIFANDLTRLDVLDVQRDLRDGQWHHYALVATRDRLCTVHVDGELASAAQFLGDAFDPGGDLVFGARSDLAAGTFAPVDLDDLQLHARALADVEIGLLHTGLGTEALVFPGTTTGLEMLVGVDGAPAGGPRRDVRTAAPGQQVRIAYASTTPALQGLGAVLADVVATGSVRNHPLFAELHVGPAPALAHGPIVLGSGGASFAFTVPPGFAGTSLLVQPVALTPQAPNGLFVAGAAAEIRF